MILSTLRTWEIHYPLKKKRFIQKRQKKVLYRYYKSEDKKVEGFWEVVGTEKLTVDPSVSPSISDA